jgi:hypothetical protein
MIESRPEYDGIFEMDIDTTDYRKFNSVLASRYKALMSKAKTVFGVSDDNRHEQETDYTDIVSWLLLNFSSTRARKHYVVETSHWRLVKKSGGRIEMLFRGYGRFSTTNINMTSVVSMLREMLHDTKYVYNQNFDNLKIVFRYLFGKVIFSRYVVNGVDSDYRPKLFRCCIGEGRDIKIDYELRYSHTCYHYKISDKPKTFLLDSTSEARIITFEHDGKVYDMRETYDIFDRAKDKYVCSIDAALYRVFDSGLSVSDIFSRYGSDDTRYIDAGNISVKVAKDAKSANISAIDKYESIIAQCEVEFGLLKQIEGCGLMLNDSLHGSD